MKTKWDIASVIGYVLIIIALLITGCSVAVLLIKI